MPNKTFTPEQIVGMLRQIEVLVSQGKTVPLACKTAGSGMPSHSLPRLVGIPAKPNTKSGMIPNGIPG